MKNLTTLFTAFLLLAGLSLSAQEQSQPQKTATHRDSVYMAKLNSSGNLMIAGGVGLVAAGGYLLYQGITVYNTQTAGITPAEQSRNEQNKKQGTIYLVAAGVGLAGGVVLTAFGARNKVEFKRRKNAMNADLGILPNGQLGFALNF
jgi:hypothetical protein